MIAIKALQKITLLDYPGKLACIVFLAGCNFRCPFCQNPDLVLSPEISPTISEEDFFNFLKKRVGLLDGVVITGGEPTLYPDLPEFIKKIKKLGFLVKLDTNGTNPKMLESLLKWRLLDYVAMDFKGPLRKYHQYVSQEKREKRIKKKDIVNMNSLRSFFPSEIKKTINILFTSGIEVEFRTTVVPSLHTEEDLIEMAKELNQSPVTNYQSPIKWFLQQFRPIKCLDPKFEKVKPYLQEFFEKVLPKARQYFPQTFLRGF